MLSLILKVHKIFWQQTIHGQTVEFDNTPFVVSEIRKLDCQFGRHYYKEKQSKPRRICLQGTRKIGCKAQIEVRSIVVYSDFQINKEDVLSLSPRGLKEKKKEYLHRLHQVLAKNEHTKVVTKYHVLLPEEEAHHAFHPTHGPASYSQRVHPKLIEKIYELVADGLTEAHEVKRALKNHVTNVLCPDSKPEPTDRSYYPTTTDIRNHIYKAQRACQLSSLDQENLRLKIKEWKKQNPKSLFYFRPYKEVNSDKEDSIDQMLLYIHQEPWQQELLKRYGNTITLMDATYKTTKYELALFFIAVKTNVGYTAVADFVVQYETTEQIAEAVKILSSWNPEWQPPYFMTDYCEAEIRAITDVFPNCKVYLCDFHREQAWERWVKDRKHGLSPDEGDTLLSLLRDIAQAPSPESDNLSLSLDHNYNQHVVDLKRSAIWKKNSLVREWLEGKWLCSPQVYTRSSKKPLIKTASCM